MSQLNDLFKEIVILMLGDKCVLCQRHATTVHHIDPKGMGGCSLNKKYNPLNGCPLCNKCHTRIHSEIGERSGKKEIVGKLPHLIRNNWETYPLKGETKREIAKELRQMKEILNEVDE